MALLPLADERDTPLVPPGLLPLAPEGTEEPSTIRKVLQLPADLEAPDPKLRFLSLSKTARLTLAKMAEATDGLLELIDVVVPGDPAAFERFGGDHPSMEIVRMLARNRNALGEFAQGEFAQLRPDANAVEEILSSAVSFLLPPLSSAFKVGSAAARAALGATTTAGTTAAWYALHLFGPQAAEKTFTSVMNLAAKNKRTADVLKRVTEGGVGGAGGFAAFSMLDGDPFDNLIKEGALGFVTAGAGNLMRGVPPGTLKGNLLNTVGAPVAETLALTAGTVALDENIDLSDTEELKELIGHIGGLVLTLNVLQRGGARAKLKLDQAAEGALNTLAKHGLAKPQHERVLRKTLRSRAGRRGLAKIEEASRNPELLREMGLDDPVRLREDFLAALGRRETLAYTSPEQMARDAHLLLTFGTVLENPKLIGFSEVLNKSVERTEVLEAADSLRLQTEQVLASDVVPRLLANVESVAKHSGFITREEIAAGISEAQAKKKGVSAVEQLSSSEKVLLDRILTDLTPTERGYRIDEVVKALHDKLVPLEAAELTRDPAMGVQLDGIVRPEVQLTTSNVLGPRRLREEVATVYLGREGELARKHTFDLAYFRSVPDSIRRIGDQVGTTEASRAINRRVVFWVRKLRDFVERPGHLPRSILLQVQLPHSSITAGLRRGAVLTKEEVGAELDRSRVELTQVLAERNRIKEELEVAKTREEYERQFQGDRLLQDPVALEARQREREELEAALEGTRARVREIVTHQNNTVARSELLLEQTFGAGVANPAEIFTVALQMEVRNTAKDLLRHYADRDLPLPKEGEPIGEIWVPVENTIMRGVAGEGGRHPEFMERLERAGAAPLRDSDIPEALRGPYKGMRKLLEQFKRSGKDKPERVEEGDPVLEEGNFYRKIPIFASDAGLPLLAFGRPKVGEFTNAGKSLAGLRADVAKVKERLAKRLGEDPIEALRVGEESPVEAAERLSGNIRRYTWFHKTFANLMQLDDIFGAAVPGLRKYRRMYIEINAFRNALLETATATSVRIEQLGRAGTTQHRELSSALTDSVFGIRGGVKPGWRTEAELGQLYPKMTSETKELYLRIKEDVQELFRLWFRADVSHAEGTILDPTKREQKILELNLKYNALRDAPYFPFSTRGKWAVQMKDRDGDAELVLHFTSQKKARAFIQGREAALKKNQVSVEVFKEDYELDPFVGRKIGPRGPLSTSFTGRLHQSGMKIPPDLRDVHSSYVDFFYHGINHITRRQFDHRLNTLVEDVRRQAKNLAVDARDSGKQGTQAFLRASSTLNRLAENMANHKDYAMNPKSEWAALRAFGFLWYFMFMPKAAFINLTQVPLVTQPFLTARYAEALQTKFGETIVNKELLAAMRDIPLYVRRGEERISVEKRLEAIASGKRPRGLGEGELRMLLRLTRDGIITESFATDLAAAAEGPLAIQARGGSSFQWQVLRKTGAWLQNNGPIFFRMAEHANRRVTAVAAYRLALRRAKEEGLEPQAAHERAVEEARDAVERTQFEYARWNRPRLFRGRLGSNIFLFMNYVQNMLYFAGTDKGGPRFLALLLFMGGANALPFMEDVLDSIDFTRWLASKAGLTSKNVKADIRKDIAELLVAVDVDPMTVFHGYGGASTSLPWLGANIFGPPVDLSGSLSLGRPIPGTEALFRAFGSEEPATVGLAQAAQDIPGALAGIAINMARGFDQAHDNPYTYKGWESVMPPFLSSMARAKRYIMERKETDRLGREIVAFPEPDNYIAGVKALAGFRLAEVNQRFQEERMIREHALFYAARFRNLAANLHAALRTRDDAAIKEASRRIRAYNNDIKNSNLSGVSKAALMINEKRLTTSILNRELLWLKTELGVGRSIQEFSLRRDITPLFRPGQTIQYLDK